MVVLGPNDSHDLAVGYLALARPDLVPVIQRVVDAQLQGRHAEESDGTRFITRTFDEIQALAQANLTTDVIEEINVATGKTSADGEMVPSGPGRAVHLSPRVSGYFTFNGSMTLTGFICTNGSCNPASTLIHTARWHQGYVTVKTTAKTLAPGGDSANWANKSAAAKCYRGSSRCDVTGTQLLNASGTNSIVTLSQQPGTSSAHWELTFSANYLGSPYIGPSGATPSFKCDPYSATAVCKWQ